MLKNLRLAKMFEDKLKDIGKKVANYRKHLDIN